VGRALGDLALLVSGALPVSAAALGTTPQLRSTFAVAGAGPEGREVQRVG